MKNNEKKCEKSPPGPNYEKMQADSSHLQQDGSIYQKVLLGHRSEML